MLWSEEDIRRHFKQREKEQLKAFEKMTEEEKMMQELDRREQNLSIKGLKEHITY